MFRPGSKLERIRTAIREFWQPREFRISEPLWTSELSDQLVSALEQLEVEISTTRLPGLSDPQLAAICTRVWRLRNELMRSPEDESVTPSGYAANYLDDLWQQLSEAGVEIRDHTGEAVPKTGVYMLKTIAHQPMTGIERQRVIETVKPTIYLNNRILQVGEVIVGTPKSS